MTILILSLILIKLTLAANPFNIYFRDFILYDWNLTSSSQCEWNLKNLTFKNLQFKSNYPNYDKSKENYLELITKADELSQTENDNFKGQLISPLIEHHSQLCLAFDYYFFGPDLKKLIEIELIYNSKEIEKIVEIREHFSDEWKHFEQTILTNLSNYNIRFQINLGEKGLSFFAVTNLNISFSKCSFQGLCDFEINSCDWNLNENNASYKWKLLKAKKSNITEDHTTHTFNGHFIVPNYQLSNDFQNVSAILESTFVEPNFNLKCLKFWYYRPSSNSNQIFVYLNFSNGQSRNKLIWTSESHYDFRWHQGQIEINHDDLYQITIVAQKSKFQSSEIALDDIELRDGHCHEVASCDFNHDHCGFYQKVNKNFTIQWMRGSGRVQKIENLGKNFRSPKDLKDSHKGMYMYIDSTVVKNNVQLRSDLISEVVVPKLDDFCLSFLYYIYGSKSKVRLSIDVEALHFNLTLNSQFISIWTADQFSKNDGFWQTGEISFKMDKKFRIHAVSEIKNNSVFIAIDEIKLKNSNCSKQLKTRNEKAIKALIEDGYCNSKNNNFSSWSCDLVNGQTNIYYYCNFETSTLNDCNLTFNNKKKSTISWKVVNLNKAKNDKSSLKNEHVHVLALDKRNLSLNLTIDVEQAFFLTPEFEATKSACLIFWYQNIEMNQNEDFRVILMMTDEGSESEILKLEQSQGWNWFPFKYQIDSGGSRWKIKFIANLNKSKTKLIQIDNILIHQGECPPNRCGFQTEHCFWQNIEKQSNFKMNHLKFHLEWKRHFVNLDELTKEYLEIDANKSKSGHYLFLFSNKTQNDQYNGAIISPLIQFQNQSSFCLSFRYFMLSKTTLTIYQSNNPKIKLEVINDEKVKKWRKKNITITRNGLNLSSHIYIVGTLTLNQTFIALDDIFISEGNCNIESFSSRIFSENNSISSTTNDANCTFDTNICNWTFQESDSKQFRWKLGFLNSSHSQNIYVQSVPDLNDQKAKVISPNLYSSNVDCKINFTFTIKGDIILSLLELNKNYLIELWSSELLMLEKSNDQWFNATVIIGKVFGHFKLIFQAKQLHKRKDSLASVDNILLDTCNNSSKKKDDQTDDFICDFEKSSCFLKPTNKWKLSGKQTHLINGPTKDHSDGQKYLLLKGQNRFEINSSIQGPIISIKNCTVSFYYYMSPMTKAFVIIDDGIVFELISNVATNWNKLTIQHWKSQTVTSLSINVTLKASNSDMIKKVNHFFAIDDLRLTKSCLPDHNKDKSQVNKWRITYNVLVICLVIFGLVVISLYWIERLRLDNEIKLLDNPVYEIQLNEIEKQLEIN